MPQRELQPRPVGAEQRDGNDVHVRQEPDRLRRPAGLCDRGREVEAVDEQRPLQQGNRCLPTLPHDRGGDERESHVGGGRDRDLDRRDIGDDGDADDDTRQGQAKAEEIAGALRDREQLGRIGREAAADEHHANSTMSDSTGASAKRGSCRSRRSWIVTNATARPKSTSRTTDPRATPLEHRTEAVPRPVLGVGWGDPRCGRDRGSRQGRAPEAVRGPEKGAPSARSIPRRGRQSGSSVHRRPTDMAAADGIGDVDRTLADHVAHAIEHVVHDWIDCRVARLVHGGIDGVVAEDAVPGAADFAELAGEVEPRTGRVCGDLTGGGEGEGRHRDDGETLGPPPHMAPPPGVDALDGGT